MIQQRSVRMIQGWWIALVLLLGLTGALFGQAEQLPVKPSTYFTDQAGVIDAGTAQAINQQLDQFERDTSNQILVAIYPSLPDQAEAAQYSIDTYNSWQVGQKRTDNGAVLFVFVKDHQMFICTGRGLEGALPDAICKNIITQQITPLFKQGDYAAGIQAGVNAMISATKGEYKGNGQTVDDQKRSAPNGFPIWPIVIFFILIFVLGRIFPGAGGGPFIYTGGGFGGGFGGGGFGGGFGGGGGGGFSGGGGSSAGGGAGGSW